MTFLIFPRQAVSITPVTCHDPNELTPSTQIVKAYERLHAANVVHGDTGVQHVRHSKHTPGEIVLVDFDNAWVVNPARKREKADIDDEYRCVLREYGFEVPEHLRALVPPWEIEE